MFELSSKELQRIELVLKSEERHNLAMATINSINENVMALLEEAMMVANIIHGEELVTQRKKRKNHLMKNAIKMIQANNEYERYMKTIVTK